MGEDRCMVPRFCSQNHPYRPRCLILLGLGGDDLDVYPAIVSHPRYT